MWAQPVKRPASTSSPVQCVILSMAEVFPLATDRVRVRPEVRDQADVRAGTSF
jgi:hypothetical protein